MAHDGTVDEEDRQTVLDAVLAKHPDGLITAINGNGLFVPMPDSVALTTHRLITGRASALQLVTPADHVTVIEAWTRANRNGVSNALVHPAADPNQTVRLHFIDVRPQHGVFIGLLTDFAGLAGFGQRLDLNEIAPKSSTVCKDAVAVITSIDTATPKMLGWSEEELIGRRTLELLHPDDHQRAIESWMDMLAAPGGTRRVRLRHQHRKGHYLWLEVTNHNEALPLGVLQIDRDRRVIYQNERAVDIVGLGLDETLGAEDSGTVCGKDRPALRAALSSALADGRDADLECGYVHPADGDRLCSVSVRPLTTRSGDVTGAVLCDSRGIATIFIDLNTFKEINDTLGHAAGDELLIYVASALRGAIRGTDLLGRLGGDEFLIVARDVAGQAEAAQLGEQLTAHLSTCGLELAGRWVNVQASIGVAWAGPGQAGADALIARADEAMYQAKRQRSGPLGLVVSPTRAAA